MGKKPISRPLYEEMADTSWITGLRDIGDAGNKGIMDNYNKVNVFDELTQRDLNSRVNSIYNRAIGDFEKDYRNTMEKTLSQDYNRFGTTGATPSLYARDMYNLKKQRELADLTYNKAKTYDDFVNSELGRRYATMNMFDTMSQKGAIPYQQDLMNWSIRNQNKDRQWMNDIDYNNYKTWKKSQWIEIPSTIAGGVVGGIFGGPMGAMAGAKQGRQDGQMISGALFGSQQGYGGYQGVDNAGNMLAGMGTMFNQLGGTGTQGQGWGQAFGNLFNRSNQSGNSNLNNIMNNYITGNTGSSSNSAITNAINRYYNGGNTSGINWRLYI